MLLALLAFVLQSAPKEEPPPAPPPEEPQQTEVARPPVPVPEPVFHSRRGRDGGIGFTAAFGVTGVDADGKLSFGGFAGPRVWLSEGVIGSLVVAPMRSQDVTDVGLVARLELATPTKEEMPFPSFAFYVGAGPELSTVLGQTHPGVRAVLGLHLPSGLSLFSAMNPWTSAGEALIWALFILPTTLEVQAHVAPGQAARWSFLAGIGF